jgi:hypothetical protein
VGLVASAVLMRGKTAGVVVVVMNNGVDDRVREEVKADTARSPPFRRTVATRAAMRHDRAMTDLKEDNNMSLSKSFAVDDARQRHRM